MRLLILIILGSVNVLFAQLPLNEEQLFSRIKPGELLPENLLTTRAAVFHSYLIPSKDLESVQSSFQRTGIDAVVYFEMDLLTAGRDVSVSMAQYLNAREISNLVIVQKNDAGYVMTIGEYNKKANFFEQDQSVWTMRERSLEELLRKLHRVASGNLKKENYLINEYPETGLTINAIGGSRNEFYAIDLKVDPLAVPKFGNEELDKELEEIMKIYPFKYTLTEPGLSEADLRKLGLLFVLRFVTARDKVAKNVMGYDMTKSQSAIVSITYPENFAQVKNIPANTIVYKFYFKHIDSGNTYLGTKWDADVTWQQALINQLRGLKNELKIN